jgi:hypothetical protein
MRRSDREPGKKHERFPGCWKQIIRWLPLWLPSLDKEKKPGPQATAGWFERREKAKSVAGSQPLALPQWRCAIAVAARHIPSSAEEGSFPAIFPFTTETGLRLMRLVVK